MAKFLKWNMDRVVEMVVQILLNKFDCFIVIEGKRGLGKSTLAWHIARKVSTKFKPLRKEIEECKGWYNFLPKHCLLYKRDDVIDFFNKWHKTAIADEMINVTFNRDFYAEDQKTLIKIINMNRDHGNLCIACVPQFQALDNQIKNLTKIRITVVRRGFAIIHTPNHTIYSRDIWDTAFNEKIEKQWSQKNLAFPRYSKLTTCRGYLKFPDLSEKSRSLYEQIKTEQRNILMREREEEKKNEKKKPIDDIVERLMSNGVKNSAVLEGMAIAQGITFDQLRGQIEKRLRSKGKPTKLSYYYWDKNARTYSIDKSQEEKAISMIKTI